MKCTCNECAKYTGGWCRYKGVVDPAAVKADRRSRLCKPVPKIDQAKVDFGEIDMNGSRSMMVFGKAKTRRK